MSTARNACHKIDKAGARPQGGQASGNTIEGAMNALDFSGKQVLGVGGSSGIGNGIAQAFRRKGARVHVCGTRASAADYSPAEGSNLEGLNYEKLAISATAIENFKPSFDRLDVAFSSREP